MTDFFIKNLCRVRHTNILITIVDKQEELPSPKMETIHGTCASVRLDSLIALAFKASRSSMVSYIEGGQVFVNGKLITSNGYEPEREILSQSEGRDVLSMRHVPPDQKRTEQYTVKFIYLNDRRY